MEAQKILFHSLREITANIITTYERLVNNDDQPLQSERPLIKQQMPMAQLTFFINQAQHKKYQVVLQTKQQQRLVGRIIKVSKHQIILTSRDHRQNALLPITSLKAIQRQAND